MSLQSTYTPRADYKSPQKSVGLLEMNGCRIPPLDPGEKCGAGSLGHDMVSGPELVLRRTTDRVKENTVLVVLQAE